ncbi:hypothetical protein F5Y14DRAFT_395860 [Nemania sp. NC0429]|nr:hypothetical protein F5Y14DRAFT_395860 [Nemania sp. NC0429]
MPIGDLLAEISGGQPPSAPSPKATASLGIKRKAEGSSDGGTSTKLTKARQPDGSYATMKAAGSAQAAAIHASTLPHRTSSLSISGRHESTTTSTSQRTVSTPNGRPSTTISSDTARAKRPSEVSSRPRLNQSISTATKVAPSRPSPTTPTLSNPSQAPKKGSFKEIMARGAKAQEVMGKVGMIQHKSTDKGVIKKEREVAKPEQRTGMGSGAKGKTGTSYTGTGRPSAMTGRDNGAAKTRTPPKNGPSRESKTGGKAKSASATNEVVEKKVKKSATATTGYAGTARGARPGAAASKGPSRSNERSRHGGLLEPPRMRSRGKSEEEYDEDLDDFIDYDDEEEDTGPRYYDSEGSSDMEAGMSDIDSEERRAELFAREEDRREQALEEKLKREKEDRKQRWARGGH